MGHEVHQILALEVVALAGEVMIMTHLLPMILDPLHAPRRLHGRQARGPLRHQVVEDSNRDGSLASGPGLLLGLLLDTLQGEVAKHRRNLRDPIQEVLGLEAVEAVPHVHQARRVHRVRDMRVPASEEQRDDRPV